MKRKNSESSKKNIALVYRLATAVAVDLAHTLAQWLSDRGYRPYTAPEQKIIPGTQLLKTSESLKRMNLVIVLGGDGTYLRAVRLLQGAAVPILGINLGHLGFLTPVRKEEVFPQLEEALLGKLNQIPRSMIKVTLFKGGKVQGGKVHSTFLALNDVVIERGSLSQLINVSVEYDKKFVNEVKADGLIISSPTGSTAYNLAAGGPILHPDVNAFVLTAIAPHSLNQRPLLVPDDRQLKFRLLGKNQIAHLIVDGQKVGDLTPQDEGLIQRSDKDHWLLRDSKQDFFQLLREKLNFGERD